MVLRQVSDSPVCLLVDNFLDDATCDVVRALAGPRLVRSRVASGVLHAMFCLI